MARLAALRDRRQRLNGPVAYLFYGPTQYGYRRSTTTDAVGADWCRLKATGCRVPVVGDSIPGGYR
ncbi:MULTISPECIES: hypothetical protein [Rhodococcus]|uniref:hypothetical protein n=1 Tax=Rhodococcus TaxID=1827 RepID=UPI001F2D8F2A|nr:hypothetical protein [Rhodococcus erythropolis]